MYHPICEIYAPNAEVKEYNDIEIFKDTRKRVKLFGHKYIVTQRAEDILEILKYIARSLLIVIMCYLMYCSLIILSK